jgi:predicted nucleotidyltransferase
MVSRRETLERICHERGLLAVYLFGSRADDGLRMLRGDTVPAEGSDLDIGIVFRDPSWSPGILSWLQVDFEELFAPLRRVDVVPLQRVDALFQFNAIDGHRVAATDPDQADRYELVVMSRAEELLPIQRQIEIEMFGASTIDEIVKGLRKG